MSSAIRLDHVTKRFGSQLALDDVSLEVASGTVFALLGENGAGSRRPSGICSGSRNRMRGRRRCLAWRA